MEDNIGCIYKSKRYSWSFRPSYAPNQLSGLKAALALSVPGPSLYMQRKTLHTPCPVSTLQSGENRACHPPASNTPMAFQSLPNAVGSQKRKPSISLEDPCHLPALHTRSQAVPCLYCEHMSPVSSPSTTYQRSREPLSPLCVPCRLSPGASLHLCTGLFDHYILPTLQSVPKASWAGLSTLS